MQLQARIILKIGNFNVLEEDKKMYVPYLESFISIIL